VDIAKNAAEGVFDLQTKFHPAWVTQDAITRMMAMEFMEGGWIKVLLSAILFSTNVLQP